MAPAVLGIGRRAGLVRPSTGYGATACAADAVRIRRSLERRGHPFAVAAPDSLQRWLDRTMFTVMRSDPGTVRATYLDLFARNPADRVLSFMTGTAGPLDMARMIATMPATPFARAALGMT